MMEIKEIYQKLHQFVNEVSLGYKGTMDLNLIREAADRLEELESKQENLIDYNADLNNRLNKAESHIEKLEKQLSEKQPEWISVEDRLPEKGGYYLTVVENCERVCYSRLILDKFGHDGVTHWMPLPEPPKPKVPHICKYRKKPIVVEAYQTDRTIVIPTLEGDMIAGRGDYIITGVDGEKYPCKPDIFEKTYEPYFEEEEGEADA